MRFGFWSRSDAETQNRTDPAAFGTSTAVFLLLYGGLRLFCWWGKTTWPQSWSQWLEDASVVYCALALTQRFYLWLSREETESNRIS